MSGKTARVTKNRWTHCTPCTYRVKRASACVTIRWGRQIPFYTNVLPVFVWSVPSVDGRSVRAVTDATVVSPGTPRRGWTWTAASARGRASRLKATTRAPTPTSPAPPCPPRTMTTCPRRPTWGKAPPPGSPQRQRRQQKQHEAHTRPPFGSAQSQLSNNMSIAYSTEL